jgi:CheY-specific phosphatase CheX
VETVLNYEKKMIANDYDYKVVRAFLGSLTAWLIYHIAEADLKIAGKSRIRDMKALSSCLDNFSASLYDVLNTMMGLNQSDIEKSLMPDHNFEGDLFVGLNLTGDVKGDVTFVYSRDFAYALIKSMMSIEPDCLDEMVSSAMAELTNIVSGGATIRLMNAGKSCDITPPEVSLKPRRIWEREGFLLDTHQGRLQVLLSLD